MSQLQYIGARYVPKIMGEWSDAQSYEPLSIVIYNGDSYTSKQAVPVGTLPTDETYWALTGNFNGQLADILNNVNNLSTEINNINTELSDRITVIETNMGYAIYGSGEIAATVNSLWSKSCTYIELHGSFTLNQPIRIPYMCELNGCNSLLTVVSGFDNSEFTAAIVVATGSVTSLGEHDRTKLHDVVIDCSSICGGVYIKGITTITNNVFVFMALPYNGNNSDLSYGFWVASGDNDLTDIYVCDTVTTACCYYGVYVGSTDINITNYRSIGTLIGLCNAAGGNNFTNCHPLGITSTGSGVSKYWEESVGFWNKNGSITLENAYADNFFVGFQISTSDSGFTTVFGYYYYNYEYNNTDIRTAIKTTTSNPPFYFVLHNNQRYSKYVQVLDDSSTWYGTYDTRRIVNTGEQPSTFFNPNDSVNNLAYADNPFYTIQRSSPGETCIGFLQNNISNNHGNDYRNIGIRICSSTASNPEPLIIDCGLSASNSVGVFLNQPTFYSPTKNTITFTLKYDDDRNCYIFVTLSSGQLTSGEVYVTGARFCKVSRVGNDEQINELNLETGASISCSVE